MIRLARASLAVLFAMVVGLGMVGCGDDLYGECTIDSSEHCEQRGGEDSSVYCAVNPHPECASGTCARYDDSAPFCTSTCETDGDCPNGECRELVMHEPRYCVSESDL